MSRALALPLLVLLAACGSASDKPDGATLHVDAIGSIDTPGSAPRQWLLAARHQGLVQFDAAGLPVPGLATSWRVADDGRSIIFRLRAAKWSDGRPLKASEVVLSFRRILAPGSRNALAPLLDTIENAPAVRAGRLPPTALGIEAPVDNVIEIRLSAPTPELLQLLALPDAVVQRGGSNPATIGPFKLADIKARPLRFERNHDYHSLAGVALAQIDLTPGDDPMVAIARFSRGAADIVTGGSLAGLSDARAQARPRSLHIEPGWGLYGYAVNVSSGALADVRVRRALAMAIDRDTLDARLFAVPGLRGVSGLGADSASQPDWAALPLEARQAQARTLLAAAGYGPTNPLTLHVNLPDAREHGAVLAAVAGDWNAIGVAVQADVRSPAAHAALIAKRNFELAQIELTPPVDTPAARLLPFGCGRLGNYCNAQADAAQRSAVTQPTAAARGAALDQAEALVVADTPVIALFTPLHWSLVAPGVSGWADNPGGRHPAARLDLAGERKVKLR